MATQYNPEEYSQILREFAGYKLVIQGRSPRTVNEYMLDLRTFFRFLIAKGQGNVPDPHSEEFTSIDISGVDVEFLRGIQSTDIYDFLFYTDRERGNKSAARARKLTAIKSLFKYLVSKRQLLENDPTAAIDAPNKRKSLPKFLTLEESRLLLETVRTDTTSAFRRRDFAMITLFLNCGLRLSELCGIDFDDIDRYLRTVRIVGKGNKERIIYLNEACRAALGDYLDERTRGTVKPKTPADSNALFLSREGRRISPKSVEWTVNKYLERAGLGSKHYSVHKLRHTAATLMYREGGVDVRVLKEILGHEQLNTTQIYTHVVDSDVENAMSKNPLGRDVARVEDAPNADGTDGHKNDKE
ncbi:MAG: tyrosine recombinase XerC [Clostridiales bacterium]|nr:tyrosine recombinase XerC [Clostridiales bacterium]